MNEACFYCARDERLQQLMIEVCRFPFSTLYLSRDQSYSGRCIIAFREHRTEWFHLTRMERAPFIEEVALAAQAINDVFAPDKINYAVYGDIVSHLHVHLVPKYIGGARWGEAFDNNVAHPSACLPAEYDSAIDRLKTRLEQLWQLSTSEASEE
ncbi:MAG: HIT family protein [Paenibacillaceae bacterium]|nr:HIT family protein [Paenibacillaceae bacterium]